VLRRGWMGRNDFCIGVLEVAKGTESTPDFSSSFETANIHYKNECMKASNVSGDSFEEVYQKYYVEPLLPIHDRLSEGKTFYPSLEIQEKIISECAQLDCAFRFIDELDTDIIKPLFPGDKLFTFPSVLTNKDFFSLIHPAYFTPYIVYARLAYEMVQEKEVSVHDLDSLYYQITVPIRMPGENDYYWYLQRNRLLAINENKGVIKQINIYTLLSRFKEFAGRAENNIIEGVFLADNKVSGKFQELLGKRVTEYYKTNVFNSKHWKVIRAQANGEDITKEIPQSSVYDLNKKIKKLVEEHTGYRFVDIKEVLVFLKDIRVI
jgi:hypothetical protein